MKINRWIVLSLTCYGLLLSGLHTAAASVLPDVIKEKVNAIREQVNQDQSARGDYADFMFHLLVNRPEKDTIALKKELNLQASTELKRLKGWSDEKHDAEVDFIIGRFYDFGLGTAENKVAACQWMLKAAQQGHADAQNNVAYCYKKGKGFPASLDNAVMWYKKSADQNNIYAITNLGTCYYEGKGVSKDYRKAYQLFVKSSAMGDEMAASYLKKMRSDGFIFDSQ